jgi:uncharacterized phage protein gp47/JayE
MSEIIYPTREELNQASRVDIRSELLGSNPFLRNSWIGSIAKALAFRMFDFYEKNKEQLGQTFWDTAEDPYLSRWASIFNIITKAATGSSGNIVAQGTPATTIPNNSKLSSGGIQYKTTLSVNILSQSLSVISLTRFGGLVTAQTASDHNLATGIDVTIAGAVETEYNGLQTITVTDTDKFTYPIETTPSTPATGTITAAFDTAVVPVEADDSPVLFVGADTNQDSGTPLSLTSPIAGVNNTAFVDPDGLTGGADQESSEDKRIRFLFRVQNPVANFNVSAIILKALEVPGNTRVWVDEITPAVGQLTVYFTRDNDGIIPTAGDVTRTKDKILEIKPANTDESDVIVLAPTPKVVNFVFSALDPNTSTMIAAINANLDVFFQTKTEVGRDLTENEYISAIQNTIDTETGAFLTSFALSSPSGNVSVAAGEIPTKGSVTTP